MIDARSVGLVDLLRRAGQMGGVAPGEDRRPTNAEGLAGEDVVVPGVQTEFEQSRVPILRVPVGLRERCR